MSELKWNWVYIPYLDAPEIQKESALKAGYAKVCFKSEADKVIAEKDAEIAELKQEIERLKQENEMTLVGVNLHSPTSDGRFV